MLSRGPLPMLSSGAAAPTTLRLLGTCGTPGRLGCEALLLYVLAGGAPPCGFTGSNARIDMWVVIIHVEAAVSWLNPGMFEALLLL